MSVRSIRTFSRTIEPSDTYPQRGAYIYEQVSNFKVKSVWPLMRTSAPIGVPTDIFDMGLIMCSHGHDSARLAASFGALSWIMRSKPFLNIYFLEAAKAGETYEFEEYFKNRPRTVYIKKVIPATGSDNLWLKESLWTLCANYAIDSNRKLTKLCFLDSDVEFVDQMWAYEVSRALDNYDVISPHSHFYYEGTSEVKDFGLMPSTGRALASCHRGVNSPGMAFACTVKFFKERLNSIIRTVSSGGGDTYLWYQIAGMRTIEGDLNRLPYHLTFPHNRGMNPLPKIGDAAQIAVHRFHGSTINRLYYQKRLLVKRAVDIPFSEYSLNENGMPIWSNTHGGRILSKAMPALFARSTETPLSITDTMKLYDDEAILEYGAINEEYPLIIACILPDDSDEPVSKVVVLKKQFEEKCATPHRFVCITNKTIPNVETIPLLDNTIPGHYAVAQVFGALNANQNTSVLYCDLNTVLYNNIYPHKCPANTISMLRAKEVPTPIEWGSWCSNVMYYRGNFSAITNDFLNLQNHDYQYVDSANMLTELAVGRGIYPTSIEQHFCTRFYRSQPYAETELMVFYNTKPETLDNAWLPDYDIDIYA